MANQAGLTGAQAALFGTILAAARNHATTAEIWGAIRSEADRYGVSLPTGMFGAVNTMRSLATRTIVASERLSAAGPNDAIEGGMIGQAVYSRSQVGRALVPEWHAYVQTTSIVQGEQVQGWTFMPYTGTLPATVGELNDDALSAAVAQSEKYTGELLSVDAIELVAW